MHYFVPLQNLGYLGKLAKLLSSLATQPLAFASGRILTAPQGEQNPGLFYLFLSVLTQL